MDPVVSDPELLDEVFRVIGTDLEAIFDREVAIDDFHFRRCRRRAAGKDDIHISFRLAFELRGERRYGCVLVPLPDALALGGMLMMLPDEALAALRDMRRPDASMKEALLEIGGFFAGAIDVALHAWMPEGVQVYCEGCQGVRADVRPAFPYDEGDELLVGWAGVRMESQPDFEMIVMLPHLPILV